jgi:hypothetical protein
MRTGTCLAMLVIFAAHNAFATAPILFSDPAHESPVRGTPGDLLLLAGSDFSTTDTVVYQQVTDTTQPPTPPLQPPGETTAGSGTLTLVSSLDVPDSLTVSLPTAMQADAPYAIWVVDALAAAQNATTATGTTVTVPGPLLLAQGGTTLPGGYFVGFWAQIVAGPGKGQVRKIVSYPLDASGQPVTPVTPTVDPAWDVIPQSNSTLVISRESWQFYIVDNFVDNFVDQRQPLCTKGNQNEASGGRIGFYSQTADSAIEDNQQYDTSGINLGLKYSVTDTTAGTVVGLNLNTFVEVRANMVNGEYDRDSSCSWGGIELTDGASPTPDSPPPVESYGISISHNVVTHADGLNGGAIDLTRGWYAGPSPGN